MLAHTSKAIILALLASVSAYAATVTLGYVAFDVTNPPLAELDIVNQTGVNSSVLPDTTFPVTTPVTFSNLLLTVNFLGNPPETFNSSSGYFSLDPDGLSFDGQDIFNTSTSTVTGATLTGTFAPVSVTLSDGTTGTLTSASFSASISDPSGTLADGDLALITGDFTAGGTPPPPGTAPEPSSWLLMAGGALSLLFLRRFRSQSQRKTAQLLAVPVVLCLAAGSSWGATTSVRLNAVTSPSQGVSGTTLVWVTGSGFPAGAFGGVTVNLSKTCGTAGTTTLALTETLVVGSSDRVQFLVPASLTTGTYAVSLSGTTADGAFTSSNCSQIAVTHTSAVLASCNPGSSMGILAFNPSNAASTPITAYVPNGAWNFGSPGIQVVPVEGSGSPTTVSTPEIINSCSSNSVTGQTVCIDNETGVYLVSGSSVTKTLTSGATSVASFSGGACENCTVAVNEAAGTKGQAVIGMGFATASGETALQFLDLATNTFGAPVPMANQVSEDILWDPFRNLVLSPNEFGVYSGYQVSGTGTPGPSTVKEFASPFISAELDSAAEDCTTQIALASLEDVPGVYITDLSQKTTTAGTPGTLTAPAQIVNMPEVASFSFDTDGIAIAPGSTHLGIATGEFGGNNFAALSLPATSGTGTPTLVDYVTAQLPATPDGCAYSSGFDPHTTTAYTSPNSGKAFGVMADWATSTPDYLAVIDLQALLAAPRKAGIFPGGGFCGASCTHTVDPSYDLLAHGVVKYVPTGNPVGSCGGPEAAAFKTDAVVKPRPTNTVRKR